MLDFRSLVRRNASTYYDASTGKQHSIFARYCVIGASSIALGILIDYPSSEFLSVLVSALAILTGFSFGIQFILVDRSFIGEERVGSIENAAVREKVARLSSELFDNIAYFNAICLFGIGVCCALLLRIDFNSQKFDFSPEIVIWYTVIAGFVGKVVLSFLVLESAATFARVLERINYLFQKVRGA